MVLVRGGGGVRGKLHLELHVVVVLVRGGGVEGNKKHVYVLYKCI